VLSGDVGPIRVYGGGEYLIHTIPDNLANWVGHAGLELRQREGALYRGKITSVRLVAAGDVKSVEYIDWEPAYSAVAGLEFSDSRESSHAMRRWSVLGHYYYGPSPYSQFFAEVEYYGLAVHFSL